MGKESATSTNTGTLRLDNQLALALAGASRSAGLVAQKSPQATAAAGTTVAGGILIVATSVVVSPVGKFRIDFWASWFTTTPGVVTPTMRIRSGLTFFEVEAYAQQTVEGPYRIGGTIEMDGLNPALGWSAQLLTTGGDQTITLGHGAAGAGAGIQIQAFNS